MAHLLSCRLLDEACTADDHSDREDKLGMRPQVGENCVKDTKEEDHHIWFDCFLHIHYYFPIMCSVFIMLFSSQLIESLLMHLP